MFLNTLFSSMSITPNNQITQDCSKQRKRKRTLEVLYNEPTDVANSVISLIKNEQPFLFARLSKTHKDIIKSLIDMYKAKKVVRIKKLTQEHLEKTRIRVLERKNQNNAMLEHINQLELENRLLKQELRQTNIKLQVEQKQHQQQIHQIRHQKDSTLN